MVVRKLSFTLAEMEKALQRCCHTSIMPSQMHINMFIYRHSYAHTFCLSIWSNHTYIFKSIRPQVSDSQTELVPVGTLWSLELFHNLCSDSQQPQNLSTTCKDQSSQTETKYSEVLTGNGTYRLLSCRQTHSPRDSPLKLSVTKNIKQDTKRKLINVSNERNSDA